MDELLIDEKKYISSKRAAKITGYAKDYIGQLCREGRVPARLIGRNWYVLETAIQDHRFGSTDLRSEEAMKEPATVLPPKWESPRYEAFSDELLPSVNRLRNVEEDKTIEAPEELVAPESLQDSWGAWFDHIANTETAVPVIKKTETIEEIEEEKPVETSEIAEGTDEKEVNIPIHTIYEYELPAKELLPRTRSIEEEQNEEQEHSVIHKVEGVWSGVTIKAIQVGSITLAMATASLAIIGSGYLDEYVVSNSQVRIIAGIGLYNK